ncbi:hypothetical protein TH5_23930 [Thalassospira xianhensis MCCC 1A02616]|uniref:Uncharacterized protein n=1 Tax=Thalassospira xianhensis MCCC 1A02616 TaxID=1177929 RepID=A0A367U5W4_9PROT|nr:hypothetical protein TH5_23930 [Thalassospira xianhensis MCCC 1A02616]
METQFCERLLMKNADREWETRHDKRGVPTVPKQVNMPASAPSLRQYELDQVQRVTALQSQQFLSPLSGLPR